MWGHFGWVLLRWWVCWEVVAKELCRNMIAPFFLNGVCSGMGTQTSDTMQTLAIATWDGPPSHWGTWAS